MIQNFLQLTLRNLMRQKFSSFVNLAGLAMGFASFILIALYVYNENQYDRFHEKSDRIYRLYGNTFHPDRQLSNFPALLYEPLKAGIPEIENLARMITDDENFIFQYGNNRFRQAGLYFADPEIFDVFSFELQRGSLDAFRQDPHSILITQEVATKYFGEQDPIGLALRAEDVLDMTVVGILKDIPPLSHLQFSILGNFEARHFINPNIFKTWGSFSSQYYMVLRADADAPQVADKILSVYCQASNMDYREANREVWLQPLKDIYLKSGSIETSGFKVQAGSYTTMGIYCLSALLILLLASFNYINLATAKSTLRARETGIRKVLGASRGRLLVLFLAESLLMVFLALLAGIVLVEVFGSSFENITGKAVGFSMIRLRVLIPGILILGLVVGIFSGLYPAIVMSKFRPVQVLKGPAMLMGRQLINGRGLNLRFRQLLLVLQFAMSIGLLSGSLVFHAQTKQALSNTGFNREAVVVVRSFWGPEMARVYDRFRQDLSRLAFVKEVSTGMHVPGEDIGNQGYLRQPQQGRDEAQPVVFVPVDYNYFDLLEAGLAEGRSFDPNTASDSSQTVILNQSAAGLLGLDQAIGTSLSGFWPPTPVRKVIGVVRDIHFQSVHRLVQPTAFILCNNCGQILIKLEAGPLAPAVEAIQNTWDEIVPQKPMDFYFLDERYENMYRQELQSAEAVKVFSLLAVLITFMGLLGTTVFIMEARKKEFGIRKVLGASAYKITRMISLEFSLLILLSALIACPLAFYFLSGWLDNFVYRIELSLWFFLLAIIFSWILAMLTVNALAWKQARKNPVESLKYE